MSNQKIGGASYVLSVNADNFARQLEQSKAKAQEFKKKTDDVWEKIGERFGGGGGGFLAKALGAGFFGGIAGSMAIRAMNFLADGISEIWSGSVKWNQELQKSNLEMRMLAESHDRIKKIRDEWTATTSGPERAGRLAEDWAAADAERMRATQDLARLRKREETINSLGLTNVGLGISGDLRREQAFNKRDIADAEARLAKFAATADEASEALTRLTDPASDPVRMGVLKNYLDSLKASVRDFGLTAEEAAHRAVTAGGGPAGVLREIEAEFKKKTDLDKIKTLADFTKDLESQVSRLGKSAERAKLDELRKTLGEPGVSFDLARAGSLAADALERLEESQARMRATEFEKSLQLQRMAMGLTANEAKLLELRLGGATREMLKGAAAEAAILEAMNKTKEVMAQPKFAAALESGSTEAYSLRLKHSLDKPAGSDANRGATLWDVLKALTDSKKTLDKIEKKVGPAGVL